MASWSILTSFLASKKAEFQAKAARFEHVRRQAIVSESLLERFRQVEERWAAGVDPERELDWTNRQEMLTRAQDFYRENPLVKNGIRNMTNYVMGTGVTFQCKNARALEQWENWAKDPVNKWDDREKSIVRRALRDGEVFVRLFHAGPQTKLRFIDAEKVVEPAQQPPASLRQSWTNGVITDVRDVETVLGYWVQYGVDAGQKPVLVKPDGVLHYILEWDGNTKRGESVILPAMLYAKRLERAYDYQFETLRLRLAIALIEKVHAAPSEITSWQSGDDSSRRSASNSNFIKAFKPGTILTGNKGVEHEFISPKLDAGDVIAFFREYKLSIAAGLGTPEFMITSDASNANFASTLVAESPFLRGVTSIRDSLGWVFRSVFARVTGETNCTTEWGRLEARDFAADAKALAILSTAEILDKESVLERLDFDPAVVLERLNRQLANDAGDDDDGGEFEDIRRMLASLANDDGDADTAGNGNSDRARRLNR